MKFTTTIQLSDTQNNFFVGFKNLRTILSIKINAILLFLSIVFCLSHDNIYYSQTCDSNHNQLEAGNGAWIGHIYDNNGINNPV